MEKNNDVYRFTDYIDDLCDAYYYEIVKENKELKKEIERLNNIIKALHKYFEEHEQYEDNEFLRQLESCTENDKKWLEKIGG